MRQDPTVLFLDFDGVVCQSLDECFRSSWLTREGIPIDDSPLPEPSFDDDYRSRFALCRPFIRSGEDYLVVHEWAQAGRLPQSQDEFDDSLRAHGEAKMGEWKRQLYAVRERLLVHHRQEWLSWNPLYPGMDEALADQRDNPNVWILSTKKATFIREILDYHGVPWPMERILYTGPQRKLDMIDDLFGDQPALLIDDQIDHLDFDHKTCDCRLALWGYVSAAAIRQASRTISLEEALSVTRNFPRPDRAVSGVPARRL